LDAQSPELPLDLHQTVPVTAKYEVILDPTHSAYTRTINISQGVKPNNVDRFQLKFFSDHHHLGHVHETTYTVKLVLHYNINNTLETKPLTFKVHYPGDMYVSFSDEIVVKSFDERITSLSSYDVGRRIVAARLLGDMNDSRIVESFIFALTDADDRVVQSALESLGKLKDYRAFNPIANLLQNQDYGIRITALRALGTLGDPRGFNVLIEKLKQESGNPRGFTEIDSLIEALSILGDKRAISHLSEIAQNAPDEYVRKAAKKAAEQLSNK
jgi:hypothetical protein